MGTEMDGDERFPELDLRTREDLFKEIAALKARIVALEREIEGLYEDQAGEWV